MKAYALLGGPKAEWPEDIVEIFKSAKNQHDLLVGVDRGSILLQELGFIPDLAIGDFDSLKTQELAKVEHLVKDVRYSNPIKDYTDSEQMLEVVFDEYQVSSLVIVGATGGRMDHLLLNLMMLLNPKFKPYAERVEFLDKQNLIKYYASGKHFIPYQPYKYFGLGWFPEIKELTIRGARYDIANYNCDYPKVFSSNEFLPRSEGFELSFSSSGLVCLILARDIDRYYHIANKN